MKESKVYELVFGESERLEVVVAENITATVAYSGARGEFTFPAEPLAVEWLQSLREQLSERYPLLVGVEAIIEKLGGAQKQTTVRRPPRRAA